MKIINYLLVLVVIASCYPQRYQRPTESKVTKNNDLNTLKYWNFFDENLDFNYPLFLEYRSIESSLKNGTSKANYYRTRALIEAYLGNYFNAVETIDSASLQPTEMMVFDSLGNMHQSVFYPEKAYRPYDHEKIDSLHRSVDFFSYLDTLILDAKVFSINENHAITLGRSVWIKLLPILRSKGFTHLALESLYIIKNRDFNTSNYVTKDSGLFCSEVLSGDVIRLAKELGFILVPYDVQKPDVSQVERDSLSFINIMDQTLVKDENAKIVLFAGGGHICEQPIGRIKNFGTRFKEIGIDPITINQTMYYDRNVPESIENATLLIPKEAIGTKFYDYTLVMPKSQIKDGRPHWLWELGRLSYSLDKAFLNRSKCPCVIEAYRINDPDYAVPFDRIEVKDALQNPNLALEKGQFKIVIMDKFRASETFTISVH